VSDAGGASGRCLIAVSVFNSTVEDFSSRANQIKSEALDTIIAYEKEHKDIEDYVKYENALRNLTSHFINKLNQEVSSVVYSVVQLFPEFSYGQVKDAMYHDEIPPSPLSCIRNLQVVIKMYKKLVRNISDQAYVAIDSHDYY
jgi:hypothetical protein